MTEVTGQMSESAFYAEIKALLDQNLDQEALDVAEMAMARGENHPSAVCALAAVAYRSNMLGNAIQLMSELLESPQAPIDTQELLAILYCLAGVLPKALYHGKEATIAPPDGRMMALFGPSLPSFATALITVSHRPLMRAGLAALDAMDLVGAIRYFEQQLMIEPNSVETIDHYARALGLNGQSGKALGMLRSLVTLGGAKPTLLSRIGACLISLGRHDEGLAAHRAAVAQAASAIPLWGTMVADLVHIPAGRSDAVADTARWAEAVDRHCVKSPRPAPQLGSLDHLTLGVLCSALHPPERADMLSRVVGALDKSRFTVIGLGNGELSAPRNVMYRGLFARWRNIAELDVLTLGALIRGEGVAVLLDMDGLALPERAGLFLRNSAPIQAAWLNAPSHGPMPGANMHLVGAPADLPGAVVLPGGRVLIGEGFDAGPPPSLQGQGFTFGAEASLAEISAETAALWSAVLATIPGSVLAIRDAGQFDEQQSIDHIIELFGNFGVAHRIDVIKADLVQFAHQVDVVLAPVPHVNVTALGRLARSGVPVIVLAGGSAATADLAAAFADVDWAGDMVAVDLQAYVGLAETWAGTVEKLTAFRAQAAMQAANGVAFNAARFADSFSQALLDHLAARAS